jgi:hypothetical protein
MNAKPKDLGPVNALYGEIRAVSEKARNYAYQAVNWSMVQAYWQVGYLIVEHEQNGKVRAEYGKAVLKELSKLLTADFGKGFTPTNLRYMRQFYFAFQKHHALSDKSSSCGKRHALSDSLLSRSEEPPLRTELSMVS